MVEACGFGNSDAESSGDVGLVNYHAKDGVSLKRSVSM